MVLKALHDNTKNCRDHQELEESGFEIYSVLLVLVQLLETKFRKDNNWLHEDPNKTKEDQDKYHTPLQMSVV